MPKFGFEHALHCKVWFEACQIWFEHCKCRFEPCKFGMRHQFWFELDQFWFEAYLTLDLNHVKFDLKDEHDLNVTNLDLNHGKEKLIQISIGHVQIKIFLIWTSMITIWSFDLNQNAYFLEYCVFWHNDCVNIKL